jgi:hypothetical protein
MTFALKEETLVGDRGITLSGGQKWRLSLARALYSKEEVRGGCEMRGEWDLILGLNNNCI